MIEILELYQRLIEARQNPLQNPKISVIDQLRKYKDDPNIFISFTDIPKVGIRPSYHYNTPMGVYFYPLQSFWKRFNMDNTNEMPKHFATDRHYIQVIRYNGKGQRYIHDTSQYSESDLQHDLEILKSLGFNIDITLPKNKYTRSPFGKLWYTINNIVENEGYTKLGTNIASFNKNKILRKLGYAYINEPAGTGIIHPNEAEQGFFTSGKYIQMVDTILQHPYLTNSKPKNSSKVESQVEDLLQMQANMYIDKDDAESAYHFATDIVKGRFKHAESLIMKFPKWAFMYAKDIIKGRWIAAEPYIAKDEIYFDKYNTEFNVDP